MKLKIAKQRRIIITIIVTLLTLLALGRGLWAQSSSLYDLSWYSIDGGSQTTSTGGDYILGGTTGQPDANQAAGGNYQLDGGFWHCFPSLQPICSSNSTPAIYLPLVNVKDN